MTIIDFSHSWPVLMKQEGGVSFSTLEYCIPDFLASQTNERSLKYLCYFVPPKTFQMSKRCKIQENYYREHTVIHRTISYEWVTNYV